MITAEDIDICLLELSGADLAFEENIKLTIGTAFRFRETEVNPHNHSRARASPEEGGFSAPAPSRWGRGKLVGGQDIDNDTSNVIQVACENDGLGAETGRRDFSN